MMHHSYHPMCFKAECQMGLSRAGPTKGPTYPMVTGGNKGDHMSRIALDSPFLGNSVPLLFSGALEFLVCFSGLGGVLHTLLQ